MKTFSETLRDHGLVVDRTPLKVLQVNVGKLCNQACLHCHVEAGPKRTEIKKLGQLHRRSEQRSNLRFYRGMGATRPFPKGLQRDWHLCRTSRR